MSKASRIPALLMLMLLLCTAIPGAFSAAASPWTDLRLTPLFLMLEGRAVYAPLNQGPMMSTIYPPLSALAYAPVALLHTPRTTFFAAGLMAQFYCLFPVLAAFLFLTSERGRFEILLVFTLFVLLCNLSIVLGSVYSVHADAPLVFAMAMGLVCFAAYDKSGRTWLLVLSAAFISLAPWAKQGGLVAFPVVPLILAVRRRFRPLGIYCLCLVGFQAILLGLACAKFGGHDLFLWLINIPPRRPFKSVWTTDFDVGNRFLFQQNWPALILIAARLTFSARQGKDAWQKLTERPWAAFAFCGILFWLPSILFYSKVGAADNALFCVGFFLYCAVGMLFLDALNDSRSSVPLDYRRLVATAWAALLILTTAFSVSLIKDALRPQRVVESQNQEAYLFARQHPGEVYFPWHPLSVFFAEGEFYHSDSGICEYVVAGIPVDRQNLSAFLPPKAKYVAYKGATPDCFLSLMPEFSVRVQHPNLAGWIVLAKEQ